MLIDEVIINYGYERDIELLKGSELYIKIIDDYYIVGNVVSEMFVEGVYVVGDIFMYEGKVYLIIGVF